MTREVFKRNETPLADRRYADEREIIPFNNPTSGVLFYIYP